MSLPWATVHHGIIEDLRTRPRHPAYNRCLHWRVAWDMRCARSPGSQMPNADLRGIALPLTRIADSVLKHVPAGTTRGSSASVVESLVTLVTCRPAAQDRTLPFPSNRRVGTYSLITGHSATETIIRETLRRPGPHPHCGLCALHSTPLSSSYITSTSSDQSQDINIIPIHLQSKSCTETCTSFMDRQNMESQEVLSRDAEEQQSSANTDQETDQSHTTMRPVGKSVDWSVAVDNQ